MPLLHFKLSDCVLSILHVGTCKYNGQDVVIKEEDSTHIGQSHSTKQLRRVSCKESGLSVGVKLRTVKINTQHIIV